MAVSKFQSIAICEFTGHRVGGGVGYGAPTHRNLNSRSHGTLRPSSRSPHLAHPLHEYGAVPIGDELLGVAYLTYVRHGLLCQLPQAEQFILSTPVRGGVEVR